MLGRSPQDNSGKLRPEMASFRLLVLAFVTEYITRYKVSPSQGEIRHALDTDRSRVRNALRSLEKDGLIRRTSDRNDRRSVIVELTEKGVALADAAMADHVATERHLIRMFTQDERGQLASMLARMLAVNADAPGYV